MMPMLFGIDADVMLLFIIIVLDFAKIYQIERRFKEEI
jgi:hypothetical protein